MKPKLIITVGGTEGSGKSTIAKALAKKINARRIYVGGIRRELARQRGMSLAELNQYALKHPDTDVDVDKKAARQARLMAKKNIVICEGRVQFYFLPESLKIYIKVSLDEGARRIWKDLQNAKTKQQRNEDQVGSLTELKKSLRHRQLNDVKRYRKYYGFDHRLSKNYDVIIDTTHLTKTQAIAKVYNAVKKTIKSQR